MHRLVAAAVIAAVAAAPSCSSKDPPRRQVEPPVTPAPAPGAAEAAPRPAPGATAVTVPSVPAPAAVAVALASAEQTIRDPAVPATRLEGPGRAQQDAYRHLVDHPEWLDPVLAGVPAWLHATVRANVTAGLSLRALTKPRTSLPPWRIVAPAPADELLRYYREAERQMDVPWQYLAAIHLVETRMGRIRGTSVAGAQGPMQFIPATWSRYGRGDINSNRDAILAAARLLAANGAPGNMGNALYRYNPSQHYVTAVTAYADQMRASERAYLGYYHWQVYYRMVDGDRLLPVGYGA